MSRMGFVNHDRGQLIMACGTGKTLTALWIAEKLASRRTLVWSRRCPVSLSPNKKPRPKMGRGRW